MLCVYFLVCAAPLCCRRRQLRSHSYRYRATVLQRHTELGMGPRFLAQR